MNVSLNFVLCSLIEQAKKTINFPLSVIVFQGFRLLGVLDVKNTPCARDAILHGAGGSLAIGLLHFLSTSESYSPTMFVCASNHLTALLYCESLPVGAWIREKMKCLFYLQVESGGLLMWDLQALCWQHLDPGRYYVAWLPVLSSNPLIKMKLVTK